MLTLYVIISNLLNLLNKNFHLINTCSACPYSRNIKQDLKVLWDYEPLKYTAMMYWLKDVYMYQEIECEWDEDYMKEYTERKPIIEQRRKEMRDKFRNENN